MVTFKPVVSQPLDNDLNHHTFGLVAECEALLKFSILFVQSLGDLPNSSQHGHSPAASDTRPLAECDSYILVSLSIWGEDLESMRIEFRPLIHKYRQQGCPYFISTSTGSQRSRCYSEHLDH